MSPETEWRLAVPATRPIVASPGDGVDVRLAADGAEGDVPCYALDPDVTLDFVEPHVAGGGLHLGAVEPARRVDVRRVRH